MKLRIHQTSLRLLLNRSDIEQFRRTGICADVIRFSSGSPLIYTLETSAQWTAMESRYYQDCIRVLLPLAMAREWIDSDQVSLSRDGADDAVLSSCPKHTIARTSVERATTNPDDVACRNARSIVLVRQPSPEFFANCERNIATSKKI